MLRMLKKLKSCNTIKKNIFLIYLAFSNYDKNSMIKVTTIVNAILQNR